MTRWPCDSSRSFVARPIPDAEPVRTYVRKLFVLYLPFIPVLIFVSSFTFKSHYVWVSLRWNLVHLIICAARFRISAQTVDAIRLSKALGQASRQLLWRFTVVVPNKG